MTDPVLHIQALSVRLPRGADREYAVHELNLDVKPGEIVCVVGESGSGKSVTAHTVMGLLPRRQLTPAAGTITLLGEELLSAAPDRLRALRGDKMAMIFQEPMTALNPVVAVGKQIEELLDAHTSMTPNER